MKLGLGLPVLLFMQLLALSSLQQKKEGDSLSDKELVSEAERLDIKEKAPLVLAELLLDNDKNILQLIKQYRTHFLRVSHSFARSNTEIKF